MNSRSIDEVYAKNDEIAERLETLIGSLDKDQIDLLPDGETWAIRDIVEHIAIVETGMTRICAKLLRKSEAEGKAANGQIPVTDVFAEKTIEIARMKMEAPEIVQPTGTTSIEESIERLKENSLNLQELRTSFERFDSTEYRFPHPFLGELSAGEWLMLIGGHKLRHIKQIERRTNSR